MFIERFLGTLILVIITSIMLVCVIELKEYHDAKYQYDKKRKFSLWESFGASFIIYSIAAIIVWSVYLAVKLLMK